MTLAGGVAPAHGQIAGLIPRRAEAQKHDARRGTADVNVRFTRRCLRVKRIIQVQGGIVCQPAATRPFRAVLAPAADAAPPSLLVVLHSRALKISQVPGLLPHRTVLATLNHPARRQGYRRRRRPARVAPRPRHERRERRTGSRAVDYRQHTVILVVAGSCGKQRHRGRAAPPAAPQLSAFFGGQFLIATEQDTTGVDTRVACGFPCFSSRHVYACL